MDKARAQPKNPTDHDGAPPRVTMRDVAEAAGVSPAAVSMALRSGEIWILRYTGQAELRLEPSAYLEGGRH